MTSYPVARLHGRHPIPDLARIPREEWMDAMRVSHPSVRTLACETLRESADIMHAMSLVGFADIEDWDRRVAAHEAATASARLPGCPVRPDDGPTLNRQINVKLTARAHADLREAARLLAMRPATLARLLIVRGTQGALSEAERYRERSDGGAGGVSPESSSR